MLFRSGLSALLRRTRQSTVLLDDDFADAVDDYRSVPTLAQQEKEQDRIEADRRDQCGETGLCGVRDKGEAGTGGMDEAEREMLLAVVEKYWLRLG